MATHQAHQAEAFVDGDAELLARRAGLAKALAEFPEDVAAAAKQAADVMAKIKQPTDPAAEPWPPMRAGDGL